MKHREDPIVEHVTHQSLLVRLRDIEDRQAWDRFFNYYQGFIYKFACSLGCSHTMAEDVLQDTLVTLTRVMPTFEYNEEKGRFRTFLMTIVRSRIIDAVRREKRYEHPSTDESQYNAWINGVNDNWLENWEERWENEWEKHLLTLALEIVREKMSPHIVQSFVLSALEQKPTDEVTQVQGITRNTLYQHRKRVTDQLRQEVAVLRTELGE